MMRQALERLGVGSADMIAGLESGLRTALVLTGATTQADIERFPFRPDHVLDRLSNLKQIVLNG
jgi:NagD protein